MVQKYKQSWVELFAIDLGNNSSRNPFQTNDLNLAILTRIQGEIETEQ